MGPACAQKCLYQVFLDWICALFSKYFRASPLIQWPPNYILIFRSRFIASLCCYFSGRALLTIITILIFGRTRIPKDRAQTLYIWVTLKNRLQPRHQTNFVGTVFYPYIASYDPASTKRTSKPLSADRRRTWRILHPAAVSVLVVKHGAKSHPLEEHAAVHHSVAQRPMAGRQGLESHGVAAHGHRDACSSSGQTACLLIQ